MDSGVVFRTFVGIGLNSGTRTVGLSDVLSRFNRSVVTVKNSR